MIAWITLTVRELSPYTDNMREAFYTLTLACITVSFDHQSTPVSFASSSSAFPSSLPIVASAATRSYTVSAAAAAAVAGASASAAGHPVSQPPQPSPVTYRPDAELESKVKKSSERISENLHICANEPSLALYRLAEHVKKALPPTVESRVEVRRIRGQLGGAYSDVEDGLDEVRAMGGDASHRMANAAELLKNAIFLQQQIKYEQQKR